MAIDGIDEFVSDFVTGLVARAQGKKPGGRVALRAVEGHTWSVDLGGGDTSTRIEGSASDLLLWLWNRLPDVSEKLEVAGDQSVVEDWQLLRI